MTIHVNNCSIYPDSHTQSDIVTEVRLSKTTFDIDSLYIALYLYTHEAYFSIQIALPQMLNIHIRENISCVVNIFYLLGIKIILKMYFLLYILEF
jgi:hypothetical protein